MPRYEITVTEVTTTTFVVDAENTENAERLAGEMAEERSFPEDHRERSTRDVAVIEVAAA